MFGIGGSEIILIIAICLMLFGSDKIPEIARTLGKGMAQLKNATNEIKSEIHKSALDSGLDKESLTGGISKEIDDVKNHFNNMIDQNTPDISFDDSEIVKDIEKEINGAAQSIEEITGPIKRQR